MKALFSKKTQAIFFNQHDLPIQKMLDYDFLCGRKGPSIVAIINPVKAGNHRCFWGNSEIMIPVFTSIRQASDQFPSAEVFVNFASARSAFATSMEAFATGRLIIHTIVAEGMPENETRELIRIAKTLNGWIVGPATVGAIKAGDFLVGHAGGTIENIIESKLFRPGSVGVATVSGGMSNEIYNIVSKFADGIYEGVAVGGDTFPGSTLLENLLRFEQDANIKMLVLLGELGGIDEYQVAQALQSKKITKPMVAWVSGTVADLFATEIQFGHAGARSGEHGTSAREKNQALQKAGAFVPKSFNDLGLTIQKVFNKFVKNQPGYQTPSDIPLQIPAQDFKSAKAKGLVRKASTILSSISDDRGEDATYNKKPIADYANKTLGHVINALWFKGELNVTGEGFIELCLKITADHGPAVSTAHNTIVTARAGKDLVDSLASGLLTIGDRHGGAIDGAAWWLLDAEQRGLSAREIIFEHKAQGKYILGIGHRIKSAQNPDHRTEILKKYAKAKLGQTTYLDLALAVEKETLRKKNNLILNVDGAIGAIFLDILKASGFNQKEIVKIVKIGSLNAIFILGRSIGMLGHALDQKRMDQGLYRHDWDDILYI